MTEAEIERIAADAVDELHQTTAESVNTYLADASDLRAVGDLIDRIEQAQKNLTTAVHTARAKGRSWGQIAMFLGVSRQSAWERYGKDQPSRRGDQDAGDSGHNLRECYIVNVNRDDFSTDYHAPVL